MASLCGEKLPRSLSTAQRRFHGLGGLRPVQHMRVITTVVVQRLGSQARPKLSSVVAIGGRLAVRGCFNRLEALGMGYFFELRLVTSPTGGVIPCPSHNPPF